MGQKSVTMQGDDTVSDHQLLVGPSVAPKQSLSSKVLDAQFSSQYALMTMSKAHHSFCKACSLAKIGLRPSYAKDTKQNIPFLQRIQADIFGPIYPECGPFQYFMVLVDALT